MFWCAFQVNTPVFQSGRLRIVYEVNRVPGENKLTPLVRRVTDDAFEDGREVRLGLKTDAESYVNDAQLGVQKELASPLNPSAD
jgi:hypothetical protein